MPSLSLRTNPDEGVNEAAPNEVQQTSVELTVITESNTASPERTESPSLKRTSSLHYDSLRKEREDLERNGTVRRKSKSEKTVASIPVSERKSYLQQNFLNKEIKWHNAWIENRMQGNGANGVYPFMLDEKTNQPILDDDKCPIINPAAKLGPGWSPFDASLLEIASSASVKVTRNDADVLDCFGNVKEVRKMTDIGSVLIVNLLRRVHWTGNIFQVCLFFYFTFAFTTLNSYIYMNIYLNHCEIILCFI